MPDYTETSKIGNHNRKAFRVEQKGPAFGLEIEQQDEEKGKSASSIDLECQELVRRKIEY